MLLRRLEDLAALIRGRREEQDMTQDQLARQVGVRRAVIVRLEKADPGVAVGTIFRTLHALGLFLAYQPAGERPAQDDAPQPEAGRKRKRPRIDINVIADHE